MTIADLSHLPKATPPDAPESIAPDADPRFVQLLAEAWSADRGDDKPTAMGTRLRHSDAGKCARYLSYVAAGVPVSDPMDLTGVWNTSLGTLIHEAWQAVLQARYPDAEIEPKAQVHGLDASGHLDAVIYLEDRTIAYELKTIGGYGFKAAVGKAGRGRPAEGPKREHLTQAAMNGLAVDADEVVIGYLSKEAISVTAGRDLSDVARFCAEWTFPREVWHPIALAETDRMAKILALLDDDGMLAARKFPPGTLPAGAEIVDPTTGRWEQHDDGILVDTGTWWACGYCSRRTHCATTEPGRIPAVPVEIVS